MQKLLHYFPLKFGINIPSKNKNLPLSKLIEHMLLPKFSDFILECGTDEAGRGCLAGPVTAAAVILKEDFKSELLNDSKQVSEKNRYLLKEKIESEALCFKVVHIMMDKIDELNILHASIYGMHEAIQGLSTLPEFIAVDGNKFKPFFHHTNQKKNIPHQCVVKGDAKYLNIAAASILAKTYRDDFMKKIHREFPHYNWQKNKGYPTKEHRNAIREFGPSPYHRKSFKLLPDQFVLDI